MSERPFSLFERFGVELEYMIVRQDSLDVLPVTDEVLRSVAGEYVNEVERGDVCWSNELVLHVLELKTNGPVPDLAGVDRRFQDQIRTLNGMLRERSARLMPTAMHPWMDPFTQTVLWPHGQNAIYECFHRIFDCRGHGWSNLQSVHLNLPFADDAEFGRLHAAIRLVLPLLPALAASSPIYEGRASGVADSRMAFYWNNSRRIGSVTGQVVPEPVYTRADYEREILGRIYRDIAPHDPEGILQDEWLNARGAIARFDRNAIEIRILDVQECPRADLAVLAAVVETLRALVAERWTSLASQQAWPTEPLSRFLRQAVERGERSAIDDPAYLDVFGWPGRAPATMAELWRHLVESLPLGPWRETLEFLLERGTLSRRIAAALGDSPEPPRGRVREVYAELCDCLEEGRLFGA